MNNFGLFFLIPINNEMLTRNTYTLICLKYMDKLESIYYVYLRNDNSMSITNKNKYLIEKKIL